ncbi:hypothetical protein [Rubellimicrobium arenae]|uniref:hypothetical protein n=1 Tax=Rubellimicrobium arenae TaxID=2817372 RepID=UPI001FEED3A6|nr:hypothetical protein [Rubellimicrobium arenae]
MAALFAIMAALFTGLEYTVRAPSLLEFRDARPYNRVRISALFLAVMLVCLMLRGGPQDMLSLAACRIGEGLAWALDLRWSPLHLLLGTLPEGADPALVTAIGRAAATAYILSLLMVAAFAALVWLRLWPRCRSFNIWINLPQFDPATGGDVVARLRRDAQANMLLGLLLPFLLPLVADVLAAPFDGMMLREPAALVWTVIAWAFIPASFVMRGVAMTRLAGMITAHRARLRQSGGLPQTV